jgi:hypothetical protein
MSETIARPQEIIGKWFSNVAGRPNDYYFVLSSNFEADKSKGHFVTYHVKIQPSKVKVGKSGWSNFNMWREPIMDLITLDKLRKRAIRGILR